MTLPIEDAGAQGRLGLSRGAFKGPRLVPM